MTEEADVLRCPACGAKDIRHSHRRTLLDPLLAVFHRVPMRCRRCRRRFYQFEPAEEARRRDDGRHNTST